MLPAAPTHSLSGAHTGQYGAARGARRTRCGTHALDTHDPRPKRHPAGLWAVGTLKRQLRPPIRPRGHPELPPGTHLGSIRAHTSRLAAGRASADVKPQQIQPISP
jgi:hypothetical protein